MSEYHRWPKVLSSRSAASVSGLPITRIVYGGTSGVMPMWIAGPTLRKAVRLVSRLSLTEIASAPAFHRPSTSVARSESRTCWVASPSGASSTVIRTPGPVTAENPVRTSSRSIRAASACWSADCPESVDRRSVVEARSRSSRSCRLATVARRAWTCSIRLSLLALASGALRDVCTAARATSKPNTDITTAATWRGRPGRGGGSGGRCRLSGRPGGRPRRLRFFRAATTR